MGRKYGSYTAQFKFETVLEGLRGEKSVSQICRERDVTESLYYKWRDAFVEQGATVFEREAQQAERVQEQNERIADLERMVGRLALENEILKKAEVWTKKQRRSNGR
jgi:transposase-like protein